MMDLFSEGTGGVKKLLYRGKPISGSAMKKFIELNKSSLWDVSVHGSDELHSCPCSSSVQPLKSYLHTSSLRICSILWNLVVFNSVASLGDPCILEKLSRISYAPWRMHTVFQPSVQCKALGISHSFGQYPWAIRSQRRAGKVHKQGCRGQHLRTIIFGWDSLPLYEWEEEEYYEDVDIMGHFRNNCPNVTSLSTEDREGVWLERFGSELEKLEIVTETPSIIPSNCCNFAWGERMPWETCRRRDMGNNREQIGAFNVELFFGKWVLLPSEYG